jgi:hypothetical protein
MAAPPKKTFPDVDDDEDLKARLRLIADASGAHSLARRPVDTGVPTTTPPAPPAPAAAAPAEPVAPPARASAPEIGPSRAREDGGPTITLRGIPAELWRELNLRAVEAKTTVRALVLQALKQQGYSVPAGELEDKRRHNGGRRP